MRCGSDAARLVNGGVVVSAGDIHDSECVQRAAITVPPVRQ